MIDLKPTSDRLREHVRYAWWKYVVFTVLALVAANMLFAFTTPKVPYPLRTDIIILNAYTNDDVSKAWTNDLKSVVTADQKEISIQSTPMMEGQEMTLLQLMAARMAGQEGTLMLLPRSMFTSLAAGGAFVDLTDKLDQLHVPEGTSLDKGKLLVGEDKESGVAGTIQQCGIPLDQCKGLSELFVNSDMLLCFPAYSTGNWNNAVAAANFLLGKTTAPVVTESTAAPQATATAQ